MASTTQASSPRTEPFPALESRPRTPSSPHTSLRPLSPKVTTTENPGLLQVHGILKSPQLTPGITSKLENKRVALSTSPITLTGAAAKAELRKRKHQNTSDSARDMSPNPAMQAVQTLMGNGGISKPFDAPAPDKLSEPFQKLAEKITIPEHAQGDSMQASPVSLASFGTIESNGATAMTATAREHSPAGPQFVAEPAQIADSPEFPPGNSSLVVAAADDAHKAFSYPGPPPQELNQAGGPSRGMSLPGYGQRTPKSPASAKKHKCPYCATDFTRHHNLKSHLLTHSQEKPYECEKCQARFRRLHDLKRHFKLHTGEKPHICDKCKRSFARGDALARHNKGPGGCAGRRSSFGGDDDYGADGTGDGMDGVEYTGEDEDGGSPGQGRRISEPSRKRTHLETPQDPNRQIYRQYSNTYPPPPGRPHSGSTGSMGPPQVILQDAGPQDSPRDTANQPSPSAGSFSSTYYQNPTQVFQHPGAMTESPKPLSPGPTPDQHRLSVGDASMSGIIHRNRSPSLTTQMQQAHFGRGTGGRTPPRHPHPSSAPSQHGAGQVPVLPPLASQTQSRPGFPPPTLPAGPGPSMLQHQKLPPQNSNNGSNPGSMSSHGKSSGSSMRDVVGSDPNDLWAYIRTLESRVNRMENEYEVRIGRLHEKIISLEGQLSNAGSYTSEMNQNRYP